ncbi:hypothetical protein [Amycolatopsis sp. CA-230715]|uniref:hypothetical protein n=1 Tax=Amycolatopsis sp. CA-230715 TaxID=2745196 RepID=UPI001C00DBFB|nr:hypothetical protein [Amycolatopsis sp. CA-230715]
MRGSSYIHASSGGRTLISLAWILAIFEIAWETGSAHPGFLMIDSPQKNLGQGGDRDAEFADSVAVADFYHHYTIGWLVLVKVLRSSSWTTPRQHQPTMTSSSASRGELINHRTD